MACIKHADDLASKGITNRNVFTILCDPFHKYASKFGDDEELQKMGLPLYSTSKLHWPVPASVTVRSYNGSEILSVSGWDVESQRTAFANRKHRRSLATEPASGAVRSRL
jgi:hypothetical protein